MYCMESGKVAPERKNPKDSYGEEGGARRPPPVSPGLRGVGGPSGGSGGALCNFPVGIADSYRGVCYCTMSAVPGLHPKSVNLGQEGYLKEKYIFSSAQA